MTQNKDDSINSLLQHGRIVNNNCCVVFTAARLTYLILCPRWCKWKVTITYLLIRTKNN